MKKIASIVTAVVLFIAAGLSANAQDQSKRAVAEELLNLVNMKETIERTSAMLKQMVAAQIQQMKPPTEDTTVSAKVTGQVEKIMDTVSRETSWDQMKEDYITLYSEIFTEPELKDIIAFYKTPSGQALIKKQPEVMKRSMELSQKKMSELMPKIQAMTDALKQDIVSQPPPKPEGK